MTRRTYWGFAALIILLIAAGGFIYWQLLTVQQLKEQFAQEVKEFEEDNQQKQPPIDYTKPPPGKTFANGGHWHNGEWHDEAHEPISDTVFVEPSENPNIAAFIIDVSQIASVEDVNAIQIPTPQVLKNLSPDELSNLIYFSSTLTNRSRDIGNKDVETSYALLIKSSRYRKALNREMNARREETRRVLREKGLIGEEGTVTIPKNLTNFSHAEPFDPREATEK